MVQVRESKAQTMRNIRLTLAYDGTNYVGWQVQPNGPSIQTAVEEAIKLLTREASRVVAAGRTDSGVHALGQVAHFHTDCRIPCEKIKTGLQRFLPDDIVVRSVEDVPPDFHARYSAVCKRYRYVIYNSRSRIPFLDRYVYQIDKQVDAAIMHEAAQTLVGTHDFRSFESQFPNRSTSLRTVTELTIARVPGWPIWAQHDLQNRAAARKTEARKTDFVCLEIVADGFLYNMVRSIAGTLLQVGLSRWTVDDVQRILAAGNRDQAGKTLPPHGLYLVQVDYDETD